MLALLTLVGGLYLWQAGEIASARHHIQELEEEREHWQRKNTELWKEITELTRVTALTERARALGFSLPQEEMYLKLHEGSISGPRSAP
jgi:cell division protein FtsL